MPDTLRNAKNLCAAIKGGTVLNYPWLRKSKMVILGILELKAAPVGGQEQGSKNVITRDASGKQNIPGVNGLIWSV